jgi:type II secretory pathway pseudopilin PulG
MIMQLPPLKKRRTAGFTIVELLVVIAILFVLIGLVMVALRTGRRAASRTESLNALRQMTSAYNVYATEHKGRLMPGFVDPADLPGQSAPPPAPNELDVRAKLRTGYVLEEGDTSSYVWRLAPYLDHNWDIYMTDYRNAQLVAALESEYGNGDGVGGDAFGAGSAGPDQFGIARVPSYGLNSIYLGGDNFHVDESLSPWIIGADVQNNPDTIAAVRLSMVKNPGKMIVFGACRYQGPPDLPAYGDSALGYCELRAPYANFDPVTQTGSDQQWTVSTEGEAVLQGAGPAGLPFSRLEDDRVPISHLDGSTEAEYIHRLAEDMSRWAPNAVSSN